MKTSDITDADFLAAVQQLHDETKMWAYVDDLMERLNAPDKIIRSKARRLINRGALDGCWCGCRGDFEIPGWRTVR